MRRQSVPMPSSSSSFAFSCYFTYHYIHTVNICIFLFITSAYASGFNVFNPLIRLPTSGIYRNTSTTVLLNIEDFGAKWEFGIIDATKSLQEAWKVACSLSSRAKILIPKGNHYVIKPSVFSGPCRSKVTLKVSGFISASKDPEVWDGFEVHKWLYFHDVRHLTVEGNGVIDGPNLNQSAQVFKTNASNPCTQAPTMITFHKCKNLKVRNITLLHSQQMHMVFSFCMHVVASDVNVIVADSSQNSSGIHISSSAHVKLMRSSLNTGGDCISIVGNSSHIRIENTVCFDGHGISIGSLGKYNSYAAVQNVTVDGAVLFRTKNGLRIKTWQGGSGFAKNITFQNVWMHNVSNPISINQYYCDSSTPCLNQTSAVRIESVSFRRIRGTSVSDKAVVFTCSDAYPCKRLFLEKVEITSTNYSSVKSFCWEAYGKTSGTVYPPPCVTSGDIIIRHNVKSNWTRW